MYNTRPGWEEGSATRRVALVEFENSKSEHMLIFLIGNRYEEKVQILT